MIGAISARLSDTVPALTGRVAGAVGFGRLIEAGKLPAKTPAAFVLPAGIQGGHVAAAAGAYVQDTDEILTVMLALRVHDAAGQRGGDPLKALIDAVLGALCGWCPAGPATGVLRLVRGSLMSMNAGLILYQIDLALSNQLRISR